VRGGSNWALKFLKLEARPIQILVKFVTAVLV